MPKKKAAVKKESIYYSILRDADTDGLPYCCGVSVLGDFASGKDYPSPCEVTDGVSYNHAYCDHTPDYGTKAEVQVQDKLTIATTIPRQKDAIRALQATGFRAVTTFLNPGSGNKVTLWVKNPPRRRSTR